MAVDFSGIILNGLLHGTVSILKVFLVPIFLWILLPGLISQVVFKSRQAYSIGAFVGLLALFTIGPFGNKI